MRNSIKFEPITARKIPDCEIFFNKISLFQSTNGIHEFLNKNRQYNSDVLYDPRCYTSVFGNRIAVKNSDSGNYEIMYRDKQSRGFYKNPFTLKNNEYGRIVYNDRYASFGSDLYYELHIINFLNCDKSKYREKIFFRKIPDYEYKDMKYFRYC